MTRLIEQILKSSNNIKIKTTLVVGRDVSNRNSKYLRKKRINLATLERITPHLEQK